MSQFEPLVSIIIPTRNRKEFLLDAVRSALAQTYVNIQIIVHDNDSSDGTKEYLQTAVTDPRLEYFRSSTYLSMNENWNAAFGKITGELFVRLDDDNVLANDFVEHAVKAMRLHEYDVVTYSPLIVNLHHKIYTLFEAEDRFFSLTRFQELYVEYFNITDSNYSLYKTAQIKDLFLDGNVYITTLPDRYMNYCLINAFPDLRVGFNAAIKGVTRFDYRAPYGADYSLTYVDYDQLTVEEIMQKKDCLTNFHMHRANALSFFLRQHVDSEVRDFFTTKILDPYFERTLMKLGHIYTAKEAYTWNEFLIYNQYVFEIFSRLLKRPFSRFENRTVALSCIAIGKNVAIGNIRSLRNIVLGKKRVAIIPEHQIGDTIVQEIIAGLPVTRYSQYSSNGTVKDFLKKLNIYTP